MSTSSRVNRLVGLYSALPEIFSAAGSSPDDAALAGGVAPGELRLGHLGELGALGGERRWGALGAARDGDGEGLGGLRLGQDGVHAEHLGARLLLARRKAILPPAAMPPSLSTKKSESSGSSSTAPPAAASSCFFAMYASLRDRSCGARACPWAYPSCLERACVRMQERLGATDGLDARLRDAGSYSRAEATSGPAPAAERRVASRGRCRRVRYLPRVSRRAWSVSAAAPPSVSEKKRRRLRRVRETTAHAGVSLLGFRSRAHCIESSS